MVILVFGRISPHSKMDILPLLRALQRIFHQGTDRAAVRLIIAGWVGPKDDFPGTLKALARNMNLRLDLIPSPDENEKRRLFGVADIFVSLADNPQETFGLCLLEAGCMGLPVVVSDFDGYRDIVLENQTGLLVPTLGSERTGFVDEMAPLVSDYHYHLWLAQGTVVSVPCLAERLLRLVQDAPFRQRMGRTAHDRIVSRFSWDRIVQKYVTLWDELWDRPVARNGLATAHPQALSYGRVFGSYCTEHVSASMELVWTRCGKNIYHEREFPLVYAGLEQWVTPERIRYLLFLARKPVPCASLVQRMADQYPHLGKDLVLFVVMWSLKHDLIQIVDCGSPYSHVTPG